MKWSEERKRFLENLFPDQRLYFANMDDSHMKINLKNVDVLEYDFIVGYVKKASCYIFCEAKLHDKRDALCLGIARDALKKLEGITVVHKQLYIAGAPRSLFEKLACVPLNEIETFARDYEIILTSQRPINAGSEAMDYGAYDVVTDTIKKK